MPRSGPTGGVHLRSSISANSIRVLFFCSGHSIYDWTFLYISIIYSVILLKLPNCHFSQLPAICIDYRIHQAFHYWTFTEIHQPFASRFTNLSIPSSQVWSKVQWRSLLGEAAATCVSNTLSTKTTRYWCCMWGPMCILYMYIIIIIYFYCCIIIINYYYYIYIYHISLQYSTVSNLISCNIM